MVVSLIKSKRGVGIQDLVFMGVVLLAFSVGILIMFKVSDEFNTRFQEDDRITQDGKDAFGKIHNYYPGVVDNSFLLLSIGLGLAAVVMSMFVRFHPVFFVFFLFFLVIIIFISGIFSNIYQEMIINPELSSLAAELTFTTFIMKLLPFIVGTIGFLLSIVMYKGWANAQV